MARAKKVRTLVIRVEEDVYELLQKEVEDRRDSISHLIRALIYDHYNISPVRKGK